MACGRITTGTCRVYATSDHARILDDVREAGSRGALLVVLRCKQRWEPGIAGAEVVYGKNPLAVFVSLGNLSDDGFLRVCERLE